MRCFTIFTILFLSICANIQGQDYKVNVETSLNVRSTPNVNGKKIGVLQNGDIVQVYKINDGWAQIHYNGGFSYVNSDYLSRTPRSALESPSSTFSISSLFSIMDDLPWDMKGVGKPTLPIDLIFLIIGLQIFLVIMRTLEDKHTLDIDGAFLLILTCLFLGLCVLEIYAMFNFSELIWFCSPSKVGWILTIINFVIYTVVIYMHAMNSLYFLQRVKSLSTGVDIRIGLYSYGIALVLLIFTENSIVILLLILVQLFQCGRIFYYNTDSIGFGILQILVYLLGSFALLVIFLPFIPLLIAAIVLFIILKIFSDDDKARTCNRCELYDGRYCHYKNKNVASGDDCKEFRPR